MTQSDLKKLSFDLVAALCTGTDVNPVLLNWETMEDCLRLAIQSVQITPEQEAVLRAVGNWINQHPSGVSCGECLTVIRNAGEALERAEREAPCPK